MVKDSEEWTLVLKQSPDFETNQELNITIKATDSNENSFSKDFVIQVIDIDETPPNQPPVSITLSRLSINEDTAINSAVANISVEDPDDTIHSLIINGPDKDLFEIDEDRLILVAELDFESKRVLNINIAATDTANNTISQDFEILVNDVHEQFGVQDFSLSNSIVRNPVNGIQIGEFVEDPVADEYEYRLLNRRGIFSIFENQLILKNARRFNRLTSRSRSLVIIVEARDPISGETKTRRFRIARQRNRSTSASDIIYRAPTAIILSNKIVRQGQAAGAVVGAITVEDPDANDKHVFKLKGKHAKLFVIEENQLKTNKLFNRTAKKSITIHVTDQYGLEFAQNFVIRVQ